MKPIENPPAPEPQEGEYRCPNCQIILPQADIIGLEMDGSHDIGECPLCHTGCCFTCGVVLDSGD